MASAIESESHGVSGAKQMRTPARSPRSVHLKPLTLDPEIPAQPKKPSQARPEGAPGRPGSARAGRSLSPRPCSPQPSQQRISTVTQCSNGSSEELSSMQIFTKEAQRVNTGLHSTFPGRRIFTKHGATLDVQKKIPQQDRSKEEVSTVSTRPLASKPPSEIGRSPRTSIVSIVSTVSNDPPNETVPSPKDSIVSDVTTISDRTSQGEKLQPTMAPRRGPENLAAMVARLTDTAEGHPIRENNGPSEAMAAQLTDASTGHPAQDNFGSTEAMAAKVSDTNNGYPTQDAQPGKLERLADIFRDSVKIAQQAITEIAETDSNEISERKGKQAADVCNAFRNLVKQKGMSDLVSQEAGRSNAAEIEEGQVREKIIGKQWRASGENARHAENQDELYKQWYLENEVNQTKDWSPGAGSTSSPSSWVTTPASTSADGVPTNADGDVSNEQSPHSVGSTQEEADSPTGSRRRRLRPKRGSFRLSRGDVPTRPSSPRPGGSPRPSRPSSPRPCSKRQSMTAASTAAAMAVHWKHLVEGSDSPVVSRRRRASADSVGESQFSTRRRSSVLMKVEVGHSASSDVTDALWDLAAKRNGSTRLYVHEAMEYYEICKRSGLDRQLALWVTHRPFQDEHMPEVISAFEFVHLCNVCSENPDKEIGENVGRLELFKVRQSGTQEDTIERRRQLAADGAYITRRCFGKVLRLLSKLLRIERPYIVTHFAWAITGRFDMPELLFAELIQYGSLVQTRNDGEDIAFTINEFMPFCATVGVQDETGKHGLSYGALQMLFHNAARNMDDFLQAKERGEGFTIPSRTREERLESKALKIADAAIVGREQFAVLMELMFSSLAKPAEPKSPMQMCYNFLRYAKSSKVDPDAPRTTKPPSLQRMRSNSK